MSWVFRSALLVLTVSLASCGSAETRTKEPAVTESSPLRRPIAALQPLSPQSQVQSQQRLRTQVEALLGANFAVLVQHGFSYEPRAAAGADIRNRVKAQIETDLGGIWLDAGPAANDRIAMLVWRVKGGSPGGRAHYLAYAWFTHTDPAAATQVVGLFELEKQSGAPQDKPHPKTGLWGG